MSLSKSKAFNEKLANINVYTMEDALLYLPSRYIDFSLTTEFPLKHRQKAVLFGKISGNVKSIFLKGLGIISFTLLTEKGYYYKIVAFNQPYLVNSLKTDQEYTIIGSYDEEKKRLVLLHLLKGAVKKEESLKPVYKLPKGLKNFQFINLIQRIFKHNLVSIPSQIPLEFQNKYQFIPKIEALFKIHFPQNIEDTRLGWRVLKYEEAFLYALELIKIREKSRNIFKVGKLKIDFIKINELVKTLPYKLTSDQKQAIREIGFGLDQPQLMYRLLQGDVGSGKTIVALLGLYANYLRGDQGALMAPTEILAQQHYREALKIFANTSVQIGLLTGSQTRKEKGLILKQLKEGEIHIIIGTHAAFSEGVNYNHLGLAIIDEQQRFGVKQRDQLIKKGEAVDVLMLTATPIPRTLAMTFYGDVEFSSLHSFPTLNRQIKTLILPSINDQLSINILQSLKNNKRIFIVAPLIGEEDDGRYSAESLYALYNEKYPGLVGLVHGRMKGEDKVAIFEKFKDGITPILISTSIIEVGLDVKEANLLIVYDAERFGLSALHQLRGRIGRDGSLGVCLLLTDFPEEESKLQVLQKEEDGFKIAEFDLKYRGPGDIMGIRQSGIPDLTYLNLAEDYKFIIYARQDAEEYLKKTK